MDLKLDGQSVLVLAGTSGLGRGAATALAREGADVTVCSRTQANVDEAVDELRSIAEGPVHGRRCDLTNPDDVARTVDRTVEATGGLDVLVASTGGPTPGPLAELDRDDWYDAFDLLVMGLVSALDAARPHLAAGHGGSVVAITSTSVREVIDDLALSNAVRRTVIGLVKTAARELAPDVRVNAVLPGPHATPRIEELMADQVARGEVADLEAARAAWIEDVPLERMGDPVDFGDVVAFLASERAGFVTGSCLPIDGGRLRS